MSSTLMEQAYDQLRSKLESGELPPGTQLVNRALGKELGVSTVTVREAIHRLTSEGLVEHIPNAGAFVRRIDQREVTELYRLRHALETFALDEAIVKIDADQLEQMEAICREARQLIVDARTAPDRMISAAANDAWIALDVAFHSLLVEAADNRFLRKVHADLRLTARLARTKPGGIDFYSAAITYRSHMCILRALRKGDHQDARRWMDLHDSRGLANAVRHARASSRHAALSIAPRGMASGDAFGRSQRQ